VICVNCQYAFHALIT